jgi:hypothetical protein
MTLAWRRVATMALAASAAIAATLWAPVAIHTYEGYRERKAAEPHPLPANDAQQAAIVRGLLEGHRYRGVPAPPPEPGELPEAEGPQRFPLVLNRTTRIPYCGVAEAKASRDCPLPPPGTPSGDWLYSDDVFLRDIPRKLRQELVLANAEPTAQPDPVLPRVLVVDPGIAFAPFSGAGWAGFYARFPDATGILETSRAVITADGNNALLFAWNGCDSVCGEGGLFLLERHGERWAIRKVLIFMNA